MISLYHGTTEESCQSILKNGFRHEKVVWTCSDPQMIYFYNQSMVAQEYELTPQKAKERCCELALQSAFITAAITNSQSRNLFVLEIQIPEKHLNLMSPDESAGDWDGISVCAPATVLGRFSCNVYAAPDSYSPRLAALCLCSLNCQEYLPDMSMAELERKVVRRMDDAAIEPFLNVVNEFFNRPRLVQLHRGLHMGQPQQANGHSRFTMRNGDRER